jgi:hypothetical protein
MKKLAFITIFVLSLFSSITLAAPNRLPAVLFVLPGDNSYIASRAYNYFKDFYRGSTTWVDAQSVTNKQLTSYNCVIIIEETAGDYGVSYLVKKYIGNSYGLMSSSSGFNSQLPMTSMYTMKALDIALSLLKDIDPYFYVQLLESIEDHFEEYRRYER